MTTLIALALGLMVFAYAALIAQRIPWHRAAGLLAASNALVAVDHARQGHMGLSCVFAAEAAYLAWFWWKSGGDDDTRRGRRRLRRLFTPVRRTAPSVT